MFSVRPPQTDSMYTREGVRLDADVYRPNAEGPFPVLLMRQPYGRAIASTIVYAHPCWYAAHGYIVVIQDVRGRGSSAGTFTLFENEVADGEDTLKWAAELPGCDGQIGMYGFSYQGMTQLYAAQTGLECLKAIAPAMTGYHPYADWAYENGAFCLQLNLTWALQLAAESARIAGDIETYQQLVTAAHQLPVTDPYPAYPEVFRSAALKHIESFFPSWITNHAADAASDYWQKITPQLQAVDLPMLHIGGWYDPYLRGDMRLYQEMAARSCYPHPLCVGPWGHIPWGRKAGQMDFGPAAASPIDRRQIEWFDRILKGKPSPNQTKAVTLFEMGPNQWSHWDSWPATVEKHYCLESSGLTNIREDSGKLIELSAEVSEKVSAEVSAHAEQSGHNPEAQVDEAQVDWLVHDPWNPVPALGGHSSIPAGVFERTAIDMRGDVLTYTSKPMSHDMHVLGVAEVVCAIAPSTPSYDLCAVLSRVSNGQVYNLTQGYKRVDRATLTEIDRVTLALHPTCFGLKPGEALRLSLSAACFPAYPVNAGTGAPAHESRQIDAQIITLAIALGKNSGTLLKLPLQQSSAQSSGDSRD